MKKKLTERQRFEAWVAARKTPFGLMEHYQNGSSLDGSKYLSAIDVAWEAWQASRRQKR